MPARDSMAGSRGNCEAVGGRDCRDVAIGDGECERKEFDEYYLSFRNESVNGNYFCHITDRDPAGQRLPRACSAGDGGDDLVDFIVLA